MKAEHCSFKALVSPYSLKKPVDWAQAFKRSASVDVEIGFGMGEMDNKTGIFTRNHMRILHK